MYVGGYQTIIDEKHVHRTCDECKLTPLTYLALEFHFRKFEDIAKETPAEIEMLLIVKAKKSEVN